MEFARPARLHLGEDTSPLLHSPGHSDSQRAHIQEVGGCPEFKPSPTKKKRKKEK
jgi:hypothetical protein